MLRWLVSFAAPFTLAAAAAAAVAAPDWRNVATTTAAGSFVVGNPAAKVKLVEYLSFTCTHCAHFVRESQTALHDTLVRDGTVRVETRAAMRDPYDVAAWAVARCGGPRRFHRLAAAIFAAQDVWTKRGDAWTQANAARLKAMPDRARIRAIADRSGVSAIGARAGVTPAALNACFANDVQLDQLAVLTQAAFAKIAGTPGFEINGVLVPGAAWSALEPRLRAASAK